MENIYIWTWKELMIIPPSRIVAYRLYRNPNTPFRGFLANVTSANSEPHCEEGVDSVSYLERLLFSHITAYHASPLKYDYMDKTELYPRTH